MIEVEIGLGLIAILLFAIFNRLGTIAGLLRAINAKIEARGDDGED